MPEFKLGQKVRINEIGVVGTIIAIWDSLRSETQYSLRYYDTTNRKAEMWFDAEEISVAE